MTIKCRNYCQGVDIILTNNGYEVINMGIKQSVEAISQAYERHRCANGRRFSRSIDPGTIRNDINV